MEMLTSDNHHLQATTRSQPSSHQDTHCCDSIKVLAPSCQPWAACCIFTQMGQGEHKEPSVPFCSPPSASPTAAEVTEDVGLNPSGTGPGAQDQNTACCSDKSQHQQLPGKAEHWLLFGQCSQEETQSCIWRHGRCTSPCVYNVLARCPTFFISSGL